MFRCWNPSSHYFFLSQASSDMCVWQIAEKLSTHSGCTVVLIPSGFFSSSFIFSSSGLYTSMGDTQQSPAPLPLSKSRLAKTSSRNNSEIPLLPSEHHRVSRIRAIEEREQPHITVQPLSSLPFAGFACSATLAASVKASLTPRFRIAEHSVLAVSTPHPNHPQHRMEEVQTHQDTSARQSSSPSPGPRYTESCAESS